MKTFNVSKQVMGKIVHLEQGRTKSWILKFILTLSALIVSIVVLGYIAVQIISERQGWDLLTLFQQDPEIISAYWRDTLWIFWEESPQIIIFAGITILIIVVIFIILTDQKRKIVRKKLTQLEKYH